MQNQVRVERSGWSDDVQIRNWHKKFGWDAPACDIDAIHSYAGVEGTRIEFDYFQPVAVTEYKHRSDLDESSVKLTDASIKTLRNTANRLQVPFLIILYTPDFNWFKVKFDNQFAVNKVKSFAHDASSVTGDEWYYIHEQKLGELFYKLRDREIPSAVSATLFSGATGHV